MALVLSTASLAPAAEITPAVDPSLFAGLEFRLVGPTRGGRSTAVAGVPTAPHTFFMGTTGGGVWKTTNAGRNWSNVSDGFFDTASVGAIAVADTDPNVVYVGMGSACPRGNVMLGDGVYRSTDGGETWNHTGLRETASIARIRVDPRDPNRLYVAALGNLFAPNSERGVYRSLDGGASWERVLHVSDRAGAVDLALNPKNPRILYAALWNFERKPWTLVDGGEESGIYKSTDGGDSWEPLEDGLPSAPLGRIGLALSPANPDRIWALVTAGEDDGGLYRSDDAGAHWERINGDRRLQTRGWYYSHVVADPKNADVVYALNVRFWKSTNGGDSFSRIATPHGDNHDLWIHPEQTTTLIEANDGGAAVSLDGGESWSSVLNQPTAEFYRLTVGPGFPYWLYGAQQDNSTVGVPAWSTGVDAETQLWREVGGGESGHVAVHRDRPHRIYTGNYIGTIERHDLDTGERRNVILYPELADGVPPSDLHYRFQWNAPIRISPHDSEVVYHASNYVHRSRDGGLQWETLSGDLSYDDETRQALPGGPIQHDDTGVEVYGTVFALEESPHSPGELWAGTDDGRIHLRRSETADWVEITPRGMEPGTTVNAIELSPHRPGRALVAAHRYRLGDFRPLIYRTDDYGAGWQLLTTGANGIPEHHPVRVVREDPVRSGLLYAGTEYGLFVSFDEGRRWQPFQSNLPVTQVADLAVEGADLVVATHGRSFWILDDLGPLRQLEPDENPSALQLFLPTDAVMKTTGRFGDGSILEPRDDGAWIDFYLGESIGGTGTLEIFDANSELLRSLKLHLEDEAVPESDDNGNDDESLEVSRGHNRWSWDLLTSRPDLLDDAVMSLGSTSGTRVPPGRYTVRLSFGDEGDYAVTEEVELRLLGDPRRGATLQADYEAGYRLALRVRHGMESIHAVVRTLRSLRDQVERLEERARAAQLEVDWGTDQRELLERLTELEERLIQTRNEAPQDPLNFPPRLDNQFSHLYSVVNRTQGEPTAGQLLRTDDLEAEWQEHRETLQSLLEGPVADLNDALREQEVPTLLVPGFERSPSE